MPEPTGAIAAIRNLDSKPVSTMERLATEYNVVSADLQTAKDKRAEALAGLAKWQEVLDKADENVVIFTARLDHFGKKINNEIAKK